jgi:hypothetical protein
VPVYATVVPVYATVVLIYTTVLPVYATVVPIYAIVNILLVKDMLKCVFRGKVEAKNKGDVVMYLVEPLEPVPIFIR